MTNSLLALTALAIGIWVGAIVFQAAIVAPRIFSELDDSASRRLLRALFPRFFKLGLVCGSVAAGALAAAGIVAGWNAALAALLAAVVGMTALGAIALQMVPGINAARDAGPGGRTRFRRLHGMNVGLTLVVLVTGAGILATLGSFASAGLS